MSNKHRHTLEAIFRDPPAGNLQWREVESLLNHLGAVVESGHGAKPLRRVVGNLVDNALRYAGAAEVEAGRDDAGRVWISISDRGPGIPEGQLQAVLAPFHRLESSRNRDTGGTGLGLAIAVQLAQSLGGSLRLHNREGGGLRAELQLPG